MAADRVDFIDEDDARRMFLRLLEHVAHARSTDADEHFDEVGTGNREERHLGFACDGAREQRLAGTGRADHEHALRNLAAELLELGRVLEEVDDLAHFLLRLVHACDVGKRDVHLVFAEQPRAALAEGHGAAATGRALHLAQHVDENEDQQQCRGELQQQLHEEIRLLRRFTLEVDARLVERADQHRVVGFRVVGLEAGLVLAKTDDFVAPQGYRLDAAIAHVLEHGRIGHLRGFRPGGHVAAEYHHHDHHDYDPKQDIFRQIIQRFTLAGRPARHAGSKARYTILKPLASR